jgi:hypothetical protein
MATIGKLAVQITADTQGLKTGLNDAVGETDRASKSMINSVKAIGAAFAASLTVDMFKDMIVGAAAAGRQIDQLSRLSATSTANFQAQAYAAQQFGISNEKLADIFKDVQDKVGDFMQNGAGPLADFFKNIAPQVGVTADQFRNLGGPDALQLYVSSLEKANLSQNEMTFYLEAIASDSALLLPLLQNNGQAMKDLGDEAQRLGVILDSETIKANKEFAAELDRLDALSTALGRSIGSALIPYVNDLTSALIAGIDASKRYGKSFGEAFDESLNAAAAMSPLLKMLNIYRQASKIQSEMNSRGQGFDDPRLNTPATLPISRPAAPPPAPAASTPPPAAAMPTDALDQWFENNQKKQDQLAEREREYWASRVQRIEEGLMSESELLNHKHQGDLERLDAAVMSEDERRLIRESLEMEHLDRMTDIEATARDLQLQAEADAATKKLGIEKALADERVRINQQAEQLITNAREAATSAAIGLLSALGGKSKAAAVAALALGKALSIAQIIQNTAVAQMRALAELGPLAGSAAAAKIGVMGKVQMGLVAATGLVQAAGVMSSGTQSLASGNTIQQAANSSSPMQANNMAAPGINQTITVQGIGADSLFSGDAVRTLIDRLIDAQRNGARIVLA